MLDIARKVAGREPGDAAWGTYHAAGTGAVSWCGLAREVFRVAGQHNGPAPAIEAITTADYPTPARRPANSRLDCRRLEQMFGIRMPDWRTGVADGVGRLLSAGR